MQIKLILYNKGIVDIPVKYNYYIQSAIFSLLAEKDDEYAALLHDSAYGENGRYKLFTFSRLVGKSHYHDKKLYFEGNIRLEIRSPSDEFVNIFLEAAMQVGKFRIDRHTFKIKKVVGLDYRIAETPIKIRTVTPIIAKEQTQDKKIIYFEPNDIRFNTKIREAFENKYEACFGERPKRSVDILCLEPPVHVVTNYKGIWINAYHSYFRLNGEPEYLQFLYDVGLGARTSQGFGMFDVVENN